MTHSAQHVRMPGGYREVLNLALPVVVSMLAQWMQYRLHACGVTAARCL
jgi:hypothetical protein